MAELSLVESTHNVLPYDTQTPAWWVKRLYHRLQDQREEFEFFDAYYRGDHPLPWLAPQAREEFRRIVGMARANYMGLVCDATMERVNIEGFRFGSDNAADDSTWDIWQYNNLDSDSSIGFLEALIGGQAYYLVAPNPKDKKHPYIWIEHPTQAIVEYEPGTNRRVARAGMKMWTDDWTGKQCATLYLMVNGTLRLFKYEADVIKTEHVSNGTRVPLRQTPEFVRREVSGEAWGDKGNMDAIPLIEIPNNPRLLTGGRSELYDLTDIQDRVNKTLADRLVASDYGSFPQRWASAWPDEDEDGTPNTIDVGRNRMITTEVAETKFGQFTTESLDQYSQAKREDVKDIASRSRTPAQYLLGDMSNVNGETLKAAESGHIAKVKQRMKPWAESTEKAIRLARGLAGLSSPTGSEDHRMETMFADPEFRTEGELTDAVVKRVQIGLSSLRQGREDIGYSAGQIRRMEADDLKEAIHPAVQNALRDVSGRKPEPGADSGSSVGA